MEWLEALTGGQELYQVSLDERGPILFKLLPYSGFLAIQRFLLNHPRATPVIEDEVWLSCVLDHPYTEPLDDFLAGTVSTVANLILFLSGLPEIQDKQALLEHSRARVDTDFYLQMQTAICRAFPGYTPEQLEGLTLHQLMLRMAQVEMASGQQFTIEDPDKAKPKSVKGVDFDADNRQYGEAGLGTNPYDNYGLRK